MHHQRVGKLKRKESKRESRRRTMQYPGLYQKSVQPPFWILVIHSTLCITFQLNLGVPLVLVMCAIVVST